MTTLEWGRVDTAKGTSIRVLQGGDGEPLLFFHSAGGLLGYDALLGRLAEGYRVVAPELPGYGDSSGEELLEDMLDFARKSVV